MFSQLPVNSPDPGSVYLLVLVVDQNFHVGGVHFYVSGPGARVHPREFQSRPNVRPISEGLRLFPTNREIEPLSPKSVWGR